MSVFTGVGVTADSKPIRHSAGRTSVVLCGIVAFGVAAFLWAFALPVVGLAVFVSKFFAG